MNNKIVKTEKLKNYESMLKKRRALFLSNLIFTLGTLNTPLCIPSFLFNLATYKFYKNIKDLHREELRRSLRKGEIKIGKCTLYEKDIDLSKIKYDEDFFFNYDEMTYHTSILGTTGSGKTSLFLNIIKQHLENGGGLLFVDGKADKDIYNKLVNIAKMVHREDDLFILDFGIGAETNTLNLLENGDSEKIKEVLTNLVVPEGVSGDNQYFYNNALKLLSVSLQILLYKRDVKRKKITLKELDNIAGNIASLICIMQDSPDKIPAEYQQFKDYWLPDDYVDKGTGEKVKDNIKKYLNIMGHINYTSFEFNEETVRQHQYAYGSLADALELLSMTYKNIFDGEGDINLSEIIQNSKIVYISLPALEKSNETLRKLGKMIITLLRQVTATQLSNKKMRPPVPFLLMLDEFGAYATGELTTIMQQARSLNVAVIVAMQEYTSLKNRDEDKLLDSVISNCNTKVFLKLLEPNSIRKVEEIAGKEKVFERTEYAVNSVDILKDVTAYEKTYRVSEQNRLNAIHLQEFSKGQCLILQNGKIFLCQSDYLSVDGRAEFVFNRKYRDTAIV
ncbi:type IV secretion system DNA-binding domain-containing protein [Deferribacter thermophilus]|uniref:type IV secretory system conjugative DNA transfer family protein n=1 Tax=Deferribacter thermophilus TaxID=53573 RepID=UPI003C28B3FC